jgi:hypothetical protein
MEGGNDLRRKFCIHIDEFTDITGHTQLIAHIRYSDGDKIVRNFSLCKKLPE